MSKPRRDSDYYPTPPAVASALLQLVPVSYRSQAWLDPCAGMGALGRWTGLTLAHAIDIDPKHGEALAEVASEVTIADALKVKWPPGHVVMNPPFSLLAEFATKALERRDDRRKAFVAILARQPWIGEAARNELRERFGAPHQELRCCWRPSFDGEGTDRVGVSWLIWHGQRRSPVTQTFYTTKPIVGTAATAMHRRMVARMPLRKAPQPDLFATEPPRQDATPPTSGVAIRQIAQTGSPCAAAQLTEVA